VCLPSQGNSHLDAHAVGHHPLPPFLFLDNSLPPGGAASDSNKECLFLIIVHRSPFPVGHAAAVLPAFLPAKLSERGLCSSTTAFFEEKKTGQASTNQDLGIPCFFCTKSLP
jgi:hypothetical protein